MLADCERSAVRNDGFVYLCGPQGGRLLQGQSEGTFRGRAHFRRTHTVRGEAVAPWPKTVTSPRTADSGGSSPTSPPSSSSADLLLLVLVLPPLSMGAKVKSSFGCSSTSSSSPVLHLSEDRGSGTLRPGLTEHKRAAACL